MIFCTLFILQTDSCIIDGHCMEPLEINPTNWCEQCRPQLNIDGWSINESKTVYRLPEFFDANHLFISKYLSPQ